MTVAKKISNEHNIEKHKVYERQDKLHEVDLQEIVREHVRLKRKLEKIESMLRAYLNTQEEIQMNSGEGLSYSRYVKFIEGIKSMNSPILNAIFIAEDIRMLEGKVKEIIPLPIEIGSQYKVLNLTKENLMLLENAYRPTKDFVLTEELTRLNFQGASIAKFKKYLVKYRQWREIVEHNQLLYKGYVEYRLDEKGANYNAE